MAVVAILVFAALLRLLLAFQLPCISRDGAAFCWYAEELGTRGAAYLCDPRARQHPLYPLAILTVHRLATAAGVADGPWTWQRCGQAVSFAAGMVVVILSGWIAAALARGLTLPLSPHAVQCVAMLLAALLPLNTQLSAGVMSDQLFLALYLASVLCLIQLAGGPLWIACAAGVSGGLAFLTRPEGAALPLAAVVAAGIAALRGNPRALWRAAVVVLAFVACAAPYWILVGKFSAKKDVLPGAAAETRAEGHQAADKVVRFSSAAVLARRAHDGCQGLNPLDVAVSLESGMNLTTPAHPSPHWRPDRWTPTATWVSYLDSCTCDRFQGLKSLATNARPPGEDRTRARPFLSKLERTDYSWFAVSFLTMYTLFRAGRILVPVLAIPPLLSLRSRWLTMPLAVYLSVFAIHLAAATWLLWKHDYQDQRHLLPAVALLVPFAALLLARLHLLGRERGKVWVHWLCALFVYAPLLWYALRVPNAWEGYWVEAARRLQTHDSQIAHKSLMSGSSGQRLAFYTDAKWLYWPEDPNNDNTLRWQLDTEKPAYFAVEVGPGFETGENREMLARLALDPRFASLREVLRMPALPGRELRVFAVGP